jgi:hypothetical protein
VEVEEVEEVVEEVVDMIENLNNYCIDGIMQSTKLGKNKSILFLFLKMVFDFFLKLFPKVSNTVGSYQL